jgi:hypothetical protein
VRGALSFAPLQRHVPHARGRGNAVAAYGRFAPHPEQLDRRKRLTRLYSALRPPVAHSGSCQASTDARSRTAVEAAVDGDGRGAAASRRRADPAVRAVMAEQPRLRLDGDYEFPHTVVTGRHALPALAFDFAVILTESEEQVLANLTARYPATSPLNCGRGPRCWSKGNSSAGELSTTRPTVTSSPSKRGPGQMPSTELTTR